MMCAKFEGEEVEVEFSADAHKTDLGVPRSPVWWEPDDSTIRIEALSILGVEVNPKDIPADLVNAIHALADEVEFKMQEDAA